MGAKRILFTWELGAHFGHLSRQLLIAQELQQRGCELRFAVRDTEVAAKILSPAGLTFMQAPIFVGRARLDRPPASYAELLLADGFASRAALFGRVRAWLRLFELHRPDAVVVDHSPTVLVAARIAGLRTTQIGSGFEIPPSMDPMPSFGLYPVSEEDLRRSDQHVVGNINAVLSACSATLARIASLAELFEMEGKILATFSELDPYPARRKAEYAGPLVTNKSGVACSWATSGEQKIFAYFHDGVAGTTAMVEAFRRLDTETICVIPELSKTTAARESTDKVRIYSHGVALQPLLEGADLVVSNGSNGLTSQALLAGAPLLMLPSTAEQLMHARCVRNLKAGLIAGARREREVFTAAINELLNNSMWRTNANAFSRRYVDFNSSEAVAAIARQITDDLKDVHSPELVPGQIDRCDRSRLTIN